jgi:iodotyrosine deiodinase
MNQIPYHQSINPNDEELLQRSQEFHQLMEKRRSLRFFSDCTIPQQVIENLTMTASTAPSGANKQPWTFCLVSSPSLKRQIREAAEEEEYRSYSGRMNEEWLRDLAPLGTDWQKPFLEIAPWLIIVFRRSYEFEANGHKHQNYYVNESVGLACGFLLAAIHQAGLVALTHTPSPMDFLTKILDRPSNEKPFLLIPVGYPAQDATIPDIHRKPKEEVLVYYK